MKVPFFKLSFKNEEKKEVLDSLNKGWVTTGPKVKEFEERVTAMNRVKHGVGLSSGTAGLFLTLKAFGIGSGDEVITTPFTMVATIEAIIHTGAVPVLVDIDPVTLNIDPEAVENAVTKKTRAILAVDVAGIPCDYTRLKKIARKNKLVLIDDAAHSFGAEYMGKPIGSVTDAAVFSFYPTKNITTGEGGMVVTNKKPIADKVRHLSLHAMSSSGWKRYSGGGWKYDITELGYKFNMSDLQAALGLGQLKRFESLQAERAKVAGWYRENLNLLDEYIELPSLSDDCRVSNHLFIIKLNLSRIKISRNKFIEALEKRGVGCGVHFIPIYRFSYYKKNYSFKAADFPNCERSFKRVVSLPFYPDLTFKEVKYVSEQVKRTALF